MSKNWSKEDRGIWDKSEVMQAFEKKILSNYSSIEKAAQKMNINEIKNVSTELQKANVAAKELTKTLGAPADDGVVDDTHCEGCVKTNELVEDEYTDEKTAMAKQEILSDLRKMASQAISLDKKKLAYMIERTIAEIEDDSE